MTFERRDNPDECVTVHVAHRLRGEAARQAAANFDPAEWRVRVISTPDTILADLTHARLLLTPTGRAVSSRPKWTSSELAD
jgi:hypothetical protein